MGIKTIPLRKVNTATKDSLFKNFFSKKRSSIIVFVFFAMRFRAGKTKILSIKKIPKLLPIIINNLKFSSVI